MSQSKVPVVTISDNGSNNEGHYTYIDGRAYFYPSWVGFVVSLSAAPNESVTVDYTTVAGTATPGSDYIPKSGRLYLTAGWPQVVMVRVLDDSVLEPDETFHLVVTSPFAPADVSDVGTATIIDGVTVD